MMKTILHTKIETEKIGKIWVASTKFQEEGTAFKIDYTQEGDSKEQAIKKMMKFLTSNGENKTREI